MYVWGVACIPFLQGIKFAATRRRICRGHVSDQPDTIGVVGAAQNASAFDKDEYRAADDRGLGNAAVIDADFVR